MSKLLEKLESVSRGSVPALGFKAATARTKNPAMVLIAALSEDDAKAAASAQQGADAVLLSLAKLSGEGLKHIVASLDSVIWGVSIKEVTPGKLSELKEMGCDFLVFAPQAPPALLRVEEMAKIVEIEPSLADGLVRAIGGMPIDAALIGTEGELSLSIHHLMTYQRLINLLGKPLVVPVPIDIGREDLEGLQGVGIAGVLVHLEKGAKGKLSQLRQAIDALPSPRKKKGKIEPLLPRIGEGEAIEAEPEEEEE